MTTTTALPGLALFEVPPVTDNAGAGYAVLLDNAVRAESLATKRIGWRRVGFRISGCPPH